MPPIQYGVRCVVCRSPHSTQYPDQPCSSACAASQRRGRNGNQGYEPLTSGAYQNDNSGCGCFTLVALIGLAALGVRLMRG